MLDNLTSVGLPYTHLSAQSGLRPITPKSRRTLSVKELSEIEAPGPEGATAAEAILCDCTEAKEGLMDDWKCIESLGSFVSSSARWRMVG